MHDQYVSFAKKQLYYFSERSQTVNVLLQNWRLWDCDVLMRPILECATRFIFVSIASQEERAKRIEEYSIFLSEIDDIQPSEKAKSFVDVNDNVDSVMLVGGVILNEERDAELRAKCPKKRRSTLKQKWSFSEMAREITKFHHSGVDFRAYKSLLHSYGLSSHLIHADITALDLMGDRARRSPKEKELLERAHFARLAVEPTSMLFLCWSVMALATGDREENKNVARDLMNLEKLANVFHGDFSESQKHLYE